MRKFLVMALLAVLVASCTDAPSPSPTAADPSLAVTTTTAASQADPPTTVPSDLPASPSDLPTLRVGSVVPVSSLDPAMAFTLTDWELLHATGDGLLVRRPGDGTLVPGIAEDMPVVTDEGRTYTFTLRPDVRFADGLELTAQLYVEGIDRVVRLGADGSDLVSSYVESVEATDDVTVVFHLRRPYAFFPTVVSGAAYLPVHPDAFPDDEPEPEPTPPVYGVGPWFVEQRSEREIVLERNEHYYGESPPIGRIVIDYFASTDELTGALLNDGIDVAWRGIDPGDPRLDGADEVTIGEVPGGTLFFVVLNHAREPTDDPRVRSALAVLVDRSKLIDAMAGVTNEASFSPIPPGFESSADPFASVYDSPDTGRAIELLSDAGFTEQEPAVLELAYPPERYGIDVVGAIEELETQIEATGLAEVTVTAQPWNTYGGDVVGGSYNMALLGWLYDYPDPHNYIAPFVLSGGLGGSGERLAEDAPGLSDLVETAAEETDPAARTDLYDTILRMYAETVVTLPLWLDHEYIAYRDWVSGDEELLYADALNVGPAMQLDFRVLLNDDG
jgi:peptide/nickel transport system substrate-binding protein